MAARTQAIPKSHWQLPCIFFHRKSCLELILSTKTFMFIEQDNFVYKYLGVIVGKPRTTTKL